AAAARALDHADEGQPQIMRHALALVVLALDRGVGGAATHGEVVASDHDRPAVDLGAAEHEIRGRELHEVVVLVVLGAAGDLADLVEARGIGELGDALADGETAAVVLTLDALGPAELLGERLAPAELVHLLLPVHRPSTLPSDVLLCGP